MASLRDTTPSLRLNGGLNTNINSSDIADNEWQGGQNCKTDGYKPLKRGGVTKLNTTTLEGGGKVLQIYRTYQSDGTIHTLSFTFLSGSSTRIGFHKMTTAGVVTSIGELTVGSSIDNIGLETMNDIVILAIKKGYTWKYTLSTGALAVLGGTPPRSQYVKLHKGYLFLANLYDNGGTTAYPSRIQWSDVWTPETWQATNWERVRESDGDVITGLSSLNDVLYIYKNRSIHAFAATVFDAATGDQTLRVVADGVGCVAPRSLVSIGDTDIFLSSDGIRIFDGASTKIISEKVSNIIQAIPAARVPECVATYDPKRKWYWFAYNDSTLYPSAVNNAILIYDMVYGVWYKYVGLSASSFMACNGAGDSNELYFGDNSDGNIYLVETTNTYDAPEEKKIAVMETTESALWSFIGTGSISGARYKEGGSSVLLTATGSSTSSGLLETAAAIDLTKFTDETASVVADKIQFWLYVDTPANISGIFLDIGQDSGFTDNYYSYTWTTASAGWQLISVAKSAFTATGTPDWSLNKFFRFKIIDSGSALNCNFDDFRLVKATNTIIDAYIDTKKFDLQRPEIVKRFKSIYTEVDKTTDFNLTITGYYDNATANSTLYNGLVSVLTGQVLINQINRIAKNIYFRFRNATVSQPMNIIKYSFSYLAKFLK